jgi:hypothetical protein
MKAEGILEITFLDAPQIITACVAMEASFFTDCNKATTSLVDSIAANSGKRQFIYHCHVNVVNSIFLS